MITGILTDYALMTEGKHAGRYCARIDDKPYPVMQHVDTFLLRLQKGERVDVSISKDGWISKISRAKEQQRDPETQTAMDKAGFGQLPDGTKEVMTEAEERALLEQSAEAQKRKAAGFGAPTPRTTSPQQETTIKAPEGGIAGIVAATKANAERLAQEERKDCTSPNTPAEPCTQVTTAQRFSNDQINLIKATVARGCTQTEFELLMYLSAQYGLDPIRRQIWAVKYGNSPASIFTGRDGFLEIAHRSGQFDGMESGIREESDNLIGWCRVYRKDMSHAFYVEVYEKEYTTGKNLWQTKPRIMIQKVAESSCLRRAFSVSGLYCPEEMPEQGGA